MTRLAIGIDVGGSGIKGAVVDPSTGARRGLRLAVPTPAGAEPAEVAVEIWALTNRLREALEAGGTPAGELPIGVCLPSVVRRGVVLSAANVSPSWLGLDAAALLSPGLGRTPALLNDADAAGLAEVRLGAAGGPGTTLVTTFGTGIGSALFHDGRLVPNTEFGHLDLPGHPDYERYASGRALSRDGLSLAEWAERVAPFFRALERLLAPERFVLGGGISAQAERFLPLPGVTAPILPARFRNDAGILGAALAATRPPESLYRTDG